ncbi:alpha/beta fold hydrolase [Nonomuraea sp. NPDC049269]|uniref:alpha/beta fold hydrolase n=1 Tax=Nonomuraea sp. NPDC049269 TaxID=3364349 RepID=UPI0037177130
MPTEKEGTPRHASRVARWNCPSWRHRASAFVDAAHDSEDQQDGRHIKAPTLAIWQDPGDMVLPFDPSAVWHGWAPDVRTLMLPGGHFLPETQPDAVTAAIRNLIS